MGIGTGMLQAETGPAPPQPSPLTPTGPPCAPRERRIVHMAVTPDNLLLDKPFASLVQPPANALEALQRGVGAAWRRVAGGGGGDPGAAAAASPGSAAAGSGGGGEPESGGGGGGGPGAYSEEDLHIALVKVADFGRAVPLDAVGDRQWREPLLIFADPAWRPPEVRARGRVGLGRTRRRGRALPA
jgi:hypothetical protein